MEDRLGRCDPQDRARVQGIFQNGAFQASWRSDIRGGVNTKRMKFRINGHSEEVAFACYPLSEGIVDPAFNTVGMMIQHFSSHAL